MRRKLINILRHLPRSFARGQRGLSLLEVLISTVVLGIALTGFLMALSTATTTSRVAVEESTLVYFASREFEALRSVKFDEVPFALTGEPGSMQEVPDYFKDIAISNAIPGGNLQVVASGDHVEEDPGAPGGFVTYSRDYAFDGKGAEFNKRWMGDTNALAYKADNPIGGGDPGGGGPGGGGPGGGGPGGDPGGDEDPFAPDDFQWIYGAFPSTTKVSRILYDNRFNVTEDMQALPGEFDYFPHDKDVWQRSFNFFWRKEPLGFGEILDPWQHEIDNLMFINNLGYGSTGKWTVFDNAEQPLEMGVLGVQNIDTYSDFDKAFHWPYVSEIEVYGFSEATNFVESVEKDGETQFNNTIMYFPNYLDSGFDMGRHVYTVADPSTDPADVPTDLLQVEIEFYPTSLAHNAAWQRETWWKTDTNELARFETSFYRDAETRIDTLPHLEDYPKHKVYGDDEDLEFTFTVPGASELRGRFGTFNIEPPLGGPIDDNDHVIIKDKDGNIYAQVDGSGVPMPNYGTWPWSPWVMGDTLVIQFKSNGDLNSYDSGYNGFEIDQVEARWQGFNY